MSSLASSRARAAALFGLFLCSCGGGTAGVLSSLGGGDDDGGDASVVLSDLVAGDGGGRAAQSPAGVSFRLTDSRSRLLSVELFVVPPSGSPFLAQLANGASTTSLASSPSGVTHAFGWDFAAQLGTEDAYAEGYRYAARFVGSTNEVVSSAFAVGNDEPAIATLDVPSTTATGTIQLDALLVDSASDPVALVVEWQDADTTSAWTPVTLAGAGSSQLPTSPTGVATTIFWSSGADLPQVSANVRVRVRPSDAWTDGAYSTSAAFPVDNNGTPVVGVPLVVGSTRTSPVAIEFTLDDAELDPTDVEVLYVPPSGPAVPAVLSSGSTTTGLPSDGSTITVEWDFAAQLPGGSSYATGSRLRVRALDGGHQQDTVAFAVGNDAAVITAADVPLVPTLGIIPVELTVEDTSSDSVSIAVEYAIVEDGLVWRPATLVGAAPTNVAAEPDGVDVTVFWNAPLDELGRTCSARLRLTASDGTATSTPVITDVFGVDGNLRPVVTVNGGAFFADEDRRRGIPLPFRVTDAEDDPVRVVFQWRTPYQTFPDLPLLATDLAPILADADLRRQYQIASEFPVAAVGGARIASSTSVRLPEIATDASQMLASALVGQTVELLRPRGMPAGVASTWSANPLANAVGVVACDDASSAYVLDAPSAGSWRVQRVDVATGAVTTFVTQQALGAPSAIARGFDDDHLLVASDAAGAWRVSRVEIESGLVTTLGVVAGAAPVGTVRGVAASGEASALLTVGSALVAVDAAVATPVVIASGLSTPWGVVLDPRHDGRVLVAERDWIDPNTLMLLGRVVAIDLGSLERRTVTTSGPRLARPESIAIEPGTARLHVVTNASTLDATRELRHVLLAGGGGGASAEIGATLPDGAGGMSIGPDGFVVLVRDAADLAVSGGVVQSRAITAFDAATCTATVDLAFDPTPGNGLSWRLCPDACAPAVRPSAGEQRFVWLSNELVEAGEIVLRAVPYDAARGLDDDTGTPRVVLASLDVSPTTIGGGATTAVATGIVAADLNGDGASDIAMTSQGSDSVSIFFQSSAGTFPTTPSQTLSGIVVVAPMTNPVAIRAVDVDDDGDLDLVTANNGSSNFSVIRQNSPGVFATYPISLSLGLGSTPVDVAVGDFNGDGLSDLVTANEGYDNLSIYTQLPVLGLYSPIPSPVMGGAATTPEPSAVAAGDVDFDGDLDIVCASVGADRVSVFLNTGGTFPAAPSYSMGGIATTPDPSSLALGDVDGDGRIDVAVASRTANSVAIFLQSSSGTYAATPDVVLSASVGPIAPQHVELADINGDGALDVLTVDTNDELTVFVRDPATNAFGAQGVTIEGGGLLSGPRQVATGDFDADGTVDVAVTNATSGNVALFLQRGGGAYSTTEPELARGSSIETPGASGVVAADLDADGDLDLAVASPTSNRIVTYQHWSPTVLGNSPRQTLGSNATTAGVSAVAAGDLDGDGRVDLVGAVTTSGTLAIFRQQSDGTFPQLPGTTLGGGALGGVNWVAIADLDGDQRLDLACSNPTSNDVAVFLQASNGTFPASPSFRRGGAGVTNGACHVIAADVDLDGDLDLVTANRTQNNVTAYAQTSPGTFASTPTVTVGSGATTSSPRSVVARDVDGDGLVDLACANATSNSLTVFLRTAGGTYPAAPSITLTHASMVAPTSIACADLDGDGLVELACGATTSQRVLAFRQRVRGTYSTTPQSIGSSAYTPSPGCVTLVDFDGDGDLDVLSVQSTTGQASVYFGSH